MLSSLLKAFAFFLAAVAGGLMVLWLGGRPQPREVAPPAAVSDGFYTPQAPVVGVTEMPSASRYKLGGYVEARDVIHLTAQQPGRVTYVAGEEGDQVAANSVVVALDDDALRPKYRSAWAGMASQMSAQENAQTQLYHSLYGKQKPTLGGPAYQAYERMTTPFYNMMQPFFGGGPPMQTQEQAQRGYPAINNARAAYEREMANLAIQQGRIDSLDQVLRDRRAVAPYNSVIIKRYVRAGDIVQPGQPLVDLADPNQLDLRVEIPADLAIHLRIGEALPVSVANSNVWAVVSQIFPTANAVDHTVTVKASLPPGVPAAPGMYGVAWVPQPGGGGESATAPAVPNTAIAYRGSLPVAFVVNGDGKVEMRILRLGEVSGGRTAVLSGLQAGERVVAHPASDLKSGDSIFGPRR